MCNLYSTTSNEDATWEFAEFLRTTPNADNLGPYPDVFANGYGPIVRNTFEGRDLFEEYLRPLRPLAARITTAAQPMCGVLISRAGSLSGRLPRRVVQVTSFCEPDQVDQTYRNIWFALDESRSLFFFAASGRLSGPVFARSEWCASRMRDTLRVPLATGILRALIVMNGNASLELTPPEGHQQGLQSRNRCHE